MESVKRDEQQISGRGGAGKRTNERWNESDEECGFGYIENMIVGFASASFNMVHRHFVVSEVLIDGRL